MKNVINGTVLLPSVFLFTVFFTAFSRADEAEKVFAVIRERADSRIKEIRSTPNTVIPDGSVCYYLSERSGCDKADGRTPATAWKTIARLNKADIAPSSYVLFERGGLYRGSVKAKTGVFYSAWGKGAKPQIYGSPGNGADPAKWEQTDNPRVWAYAIGHDDVGTLVFNDGEAHAVKIVIRTDTKSGKTFNKFTGKPFSSYRDLDGDLHFWHDYYPKGSGKVYLCSEKNPGERFKSIEFNVKTSAFRIGGASDVTIDNFTVKYVGVHGIAAATCKNLKVTNCEFCWIGGSIQGEAIFNRDYPTRLGNGVEIYGGCDGYIVDNCYLWQIYDAGVTHQYNIPAKYGNKRYDQKNVRYSRNVIEKCNYSIEYFLTARDGNESLMENILFEDNLMFDSGYGFCEQRPDRNCAAHIKAWYNQSRNRAKNYVVRNNAMCFAQDSLVQICSGLKNIDGSSSLPVMEGNVFIGRAGCLFGNISETTNKLLSYDEKSQKLLDSFGKGNRCLFMPSNAKK
jgi:hypothetical protein